MGHLPPLQKMVGDYLGYKDTRDQPEKPRETLEEAAERLVGGLTSL